MEGMKIVPDRSPSAPADTQRISASQPTLLRGAARLAAWAGWLLLHLVIVGLFISAVPSDYAENFRSATQEFAPALKTAGLSPQFFAGYRTAFNTLEAAAFILVGIFIFIRKSDDWMVMLASVACSTFAVLFVPTLIRLIVYHPAFEVPVAFVRALGLAFALIVFYYLFPDGRLVPGWLRWIALLWAGLVTLWFLFPGMPLNLVFLDTWFNNIAASFVLFSIVFGSGVLSQIYRYRRVSNALQRQQTKWVVFGTTMAFAGFFLYYLPMALFPELRVPSFPRVIHILVGIPVLDTFVLAAPVSLGLAILRFRLWDVDYLINRSLVYAILSGILVTLYALSVFVFQRVFTGLTGSNQPGIVSVLSTLVIALAFSPLRSRIQQVIDRRFYRQKFNAIQALAEFGGAVRDEVDLSHLTGQLMAVIRETVQPAQMSLVLISPESAEDNREQDNRPGTKSQVTWNELQTNTFRQDDGI